MSSSVPTVATTSPSIIVSSAVRSEKAEKEARRVQLGALAATIHRELRENLSPEEVVQLATELLGRVAEELREQRIAR